MSATVSASASALEAEAIPIFREVAAEFERPVLLFSRRQGLHRHAAPGGAGVLPGQDPVPAACTSTPATTSTRCIEFRDRTVAEFGVELIVASVQEAIDAGRVVDARTASQPQPLQTVTLLDAIEEHGFDAVFGGGRRDEEKARAKERVYSHRDEFGQWDPKNQRPELWSLYNGRIHRGEHIRIFPLSNWTELDIWQYIAPRGASTLRRSTSPTEREVFSRDGMLMAVSSPYVDARRRREPVEAHGPLPHGRRPTLHRLRGVRGRHVDASSTRPPSPGSPNAAPPAPTTASPRPPWKTARGRATSDGQDIADASSSRCASRPPACRRRQVHADRAAAATTRSRSSRTSSRHVEARSQQRGYDYVDLALLTDGLRAEREQGITIDVAYRYFATPRRKFIIADSPGHIQYTRNMVTGASTADLATRPGRRPPRRGRAVAPPRLLVSLLGVPHLVLAVNKMDLVDYSQEVFDEIHERVHRVRQQARTAATSRSSRSPRCDGDNVVDRSREHGLVRRVRRCCTTSNVYVASDDNLIDVRFPVQYVVRPHTDRAPGLPRLRGHGRRRRAQAGRRGRRAAVRTVHDDRGIDTSIDGCRRRRSTTPGPAMP